MARKIKVTYQTWTRVLTVQGAGGATNSYGSISSIHHVQVFNDWYDFADWLKQRNLTSHSILIHEWEYV